MEETALAVQNEVGTGLESYKIYPVQLQLMQSNHASTIPDAVLGAFRDDKTGKQFIKTNNNGEPEVDSHGRKIPVPIRAILLAKQDQRLYYPEGAQRAKGTQPICKSINGIVPIKGPLAERLGLIPQSILCKTCSKGSWDEYHNKKSPNFHKKEAKPPCTLRPQLLFCDKSDQLPYVLGFPTKSIDPLNNILQGIVREIQSQSNMAFSQEEIREIRSQGNPNNKLYELYDFLVDIGSELWTEKGFSFQRVKFSNLIRLSPEEKGKYRNLYETYVYNPDAIVSQSKDVDAAIEGEVEY